MSQPHRPPAGKVLLALLPLALLPLALLLQAPLAQAQIATAVAQLNLNQLIGTWYDLARYPIKRQKHCIGDETVLFALGDKKDTFELVTSCKIAQFDSDAWNGNGKRSKGGDGRLKLRTLWPFSTNYWVLAADPAYAWMLVGTPNHKSVWVVSRTPTLPPATLAQIESQAAAQGFATANLITIPQTLAAQVAATATPAPPQPQPQAPPPPGSSAPNLP